MNYKRNKKPKSSKRANHKEARKRALRTTEATRDSMHAARRNYGAGKGK